MKADEELMGQLERVVTVLAAEVGLERFEVTAETQEAYVHGMDDGLRLAAKTIQAVLAQVEPL
jgi:hypothetical protein